MYADIGWNGWHVSQCPGKFLISYFLVLSLKMDAIILYLLAMYSVIFLFSMIQKLQQPGKLLKYYFFKAKAEYDVALHFLTFEVFLIFWVLGLLVQVQAIWLLFLLFSSWLAYVTFEDTQQGRTMFYSYGATLYQMFVLFTTSNNPDVWIPAYK